MSDQVREEPSALTDKARCHDPVEIVEKHANPVAGANPLPWPWPPDWWRCLRSGPVSGRYEGEMTAPTPGRYHLVLRVDIDPRYANSPVLDRLSGDVFQVYSFSWFGQRFEWRMYRESWIVDTPVANWSRCEVEITGAVRFWKGVHPPTAVQVRIPWGTFQPAGPAAVTLTEKFGAAFNYSCARKSDCFRDMTLEVDVCDSVNVAPIVPSYDTHAHSVRPSDLPQRTLTIEEAFREAGVCVTVRPDRTIIDDSASEFSRWTPAELHDAMETYFSQYVGAWPKWEMWGLLAGTYDDSPGFETAGIMFDARAAYGGAGEPPERQGFAVFSNHSWFGNLPSGAPANEPEARALRKYLHTWVHEAGHAFNFLHSWDKGRPDSLSWMNYDWRYENRNGTSSYWSNFRFSFDDEELIHLRHGDRAEVIMGGDPWATGIHTGEPIGAFTQLEGNAPIEFALRSKGHFQFLEPVSIELRVRNLIKDLPVELDTRLNPEDGGVIVFIRRPDGRIVEYAPILCKLGTPSMQILKPLQTGTKGEDRYSEDVFLGYGRNGFYFDEPGEYVVRALYQGDGGMLVPSNLLRLRVGSPLSRAEDQIAQDFFTYEVGMGLYLSGSRSPFLSKGRGLLAEMADRHKDTVLGAKLAGTLASSVARPFFRVPDREKPVLKKTDDADPEQALALTEPALAVYKRHDDKALNIAYHALVRSRIDYLVSVGRSADARKELGVLLKDLQARGVNAPVLDGIRSYEDSIPKTTRRRKKRR